MPRIRNRTIRLIVFRIFAALNVALAAQGFWALGAAAYGESSGHALPKHVGAPYAFPFFVGFSVCNVIFLFGLLVSASLLWEMRHGAARRSSYLFVAMIVYIFVKDMAGGLTGAWGASATLASLAGGNAGISWMERTGYPLIALVVLNLVKYLTRRSSQHESAAAK